MATILNPLPQEYQISDLTRLPQDPAAFASEQQQARVIERQRQMDDWEAMVRDEAGFDEVANRRGINRGYQDAKGLIPGDELRKKLTRDLFISDVTGASDDELQSGVAQAKAAQMFGLENADDLAIDGLIGMQVQKQKRYRDVSQKVYDIAQKAAIQGTPWLDARNEATKLAGSDWFDFEKQFNQGFSDIYATLSNQDVSDVNQFWNLAGSVEGAETQSTTAGDLQQAFVNYERKTPQERDKIIQGIAMRAQAEGQDVDGALNRVGQALRMGTIGIASGLASASGRIESDALKTIIEKGEVPAKFKDEITKENVSELASGMAQTDVLPTTEIFGIEGPKTETRPITLKEQKVIQERQEFERGAARFMQDLRSSGVKAKQYIRQNTQGGWFFGGSLEDSIVGFAESVPSMLTTAVPVVGPTMMATSYAEQERARLEHDFPGMSEDAVAMQSAAVGAWMAGADIVQNKIITSKVPRLNATLMKLGKPGSVALFGGRALTTAVGETAQEVFQDSGAPIVQQIASALNQDIKGPDWDEWMRKEKEATGDIFRVSMLMGIVGGAGSTISDYMNPSQLSEVLKDKRALALAGIPEADALSISETAQTNGPAAAQLLQAAMIETPVDQRRAISEAAATQQLLEDSDATLRGAGIPEMVRNEDGTVIVKYNDGVTNDRLFDTPEEALADIDAMEQNSEIQLARSNRDMIDVLTQQYSKAGDLELETENKPKISLEQWAGGNAERIEIARQRVRIYLRQAQQDMGMSPDIDLGRYFILGSSRNEFADGVTRIVASLSEGANPLTVLEEGIEGVGKYLIESRGISQEKMQGWIRETESFTRQKILAENFAELSPEMQFQELIEGWSRIGVAHATGRINDSQLPASVKAFFRAIKRVIAEILNLAAGVRQFSESGKMDPQMRYWLDFAAGFDADGELANQREAADSELMNEISRLEGEGGQTFSIASGTDPISAAIDKMRKKPEEFAKIANAMKVSVGDIRRRNPTVGVDPISQDLALDDIDASRVEERERHLLALESLRGEEASAIQNEGESILARFGTDQPSRNRSVMAEARKKVVEQYKRKRDAENTLHRNNLRELDNQERRLAEEGRRYDRRQSQFDQFRDIAKLEAIARALPGELRGILTSAFRKVAEMRTTEGRERYIASLLPKVEQAIENNLRKNLRDRIGKILKKGASKVTEGRNREGKIGTAHAAFAQAKVAMGWRDTDSQSALERTEAEVDALLNELNGPQNVPDEILEERLMKLEATQIFGDWLNADSSRLTQALDFLQGKYDEGRQQRLEELKARKDLKESRIATFLKAVKREGDLTESQRDDQVKRNDSLFRKVSEGFMQAFIKPHQTFDRLREAAKDDPALKDLTRRMTLDFLSASDQETDLNRKDNVALNAAMRQFFKAKTDIGVSSRLMELLKKERPPVERGASYTAEKVSLPLNQIEAALNGDLDAMEAGGEKIHPAFAEMSDEDLIELEQAWEVWNQQSDEAKAGKRTLQFETTTVKGDGERQQLRSINQLEGLYLWLTMRQPDQATKLEKLGYDAKTFEQLDSWLKDDVKKLGLWMADYIGKDSFNVDAIHRSERGIGIRFVENYFPVRVERGGSNNSDLSLDGSQQASGMRAGFIKQRVQNRTEPAFVNAISVFLAHRAQTNFWTTHVTPIREWKSVVADDRFAAAARNVYGNVFYNSLSTAIQRIEAQGRLNAAQALEWDKAVNKWIGTFAAGTLGLRLSTMMVNLTAAANFTMTIPGKDLAVGMARAVARPEVFKEVLNHPEIQRRFKGGSDPVIQAAISSGATLGSHPVMTASSKLAQAGVLPISWVDTSSQIFGAAAVYEFTKTEAIKNGLSEEKAVQEANDAVSLAFLRSSQPTTRLAKSEFEQRLADGPAVARFFGMFASDAFNKLAITYLAARETITGKGTQGRAMAAQSFFASAIMMSALTYMIRAFYQAWANPDDKEPEELWDRYWNRINDPKKWAYAILTEPFKSVPIAGEAFNQGMGRLLDQKTFAASKDPLGQNVFKLAYTVNDLVDDTPETQEKAIENGISLMQTIGSSVPGLGPVAQLGNVLAAVEGIAGADGDSVFMDEADKVRRIKARVSLREKEITELYGKTTNSEGKLDKKIQRQKQVALGEAIKSELQSFDEEDRKAAIKALNASGVSEAAIKAAGYRVEK